MIKKYFDAIYCINLDRRPDRWSQAEAEFNKFGILNSIQRFSAIDGNLLSNQTTLLKGELGVLETHISILNKSIEDNVDSILILEDDVNFTSEFLNLEQYMSAVPSDWDFIYFGGNHTYGQPLQKINDKIVKLNFTVALHCVAIKKRIFKKLLKILTLREHQVDKYYAYVHKLTNAYGFYPNMATQKQGFSDIQNRNVNYDVYFK